MSNAARCGDNRISPFLEIARLLYDGPWVAERTRRPARRGRDAPRHPASGHPRILEGGLARRTIDAFDAFHQLAAARRAAEPSCFADYDALLLPTAPFCPTLAEVAADPIGVNSRLGTFTNFVNLCDLAAFAVPAGFDANGLPVGVTLLGPAWSEGRLAALADRMHRAFDRVGATHIAAAAGRTPDALAADETALFCIGAHMSGLPLNPQLTALGGRFLRAARTAPAYRLYALGNRPGHGARTPTGGAIEGEVWALPTAAIGTLLARCRRRSASARVSWRTDPALASSPKPQGSRGPDITRFGGWRAWLAARSAA